MKIQACIWPAQVPETLMPISAEAPGLSFPMAAWALLCCFASSSSPAFQLLDTLEFCSPLWCCWGRVGRIKAFSLSKLKVLSSPKTVGGMTAVGVSPASHSSLGKSLLSSCVALNLGRAAGQPHLLGRIWGCILRGHAEVSGSRAVGRGQGYVRVWLQAP